VPIGLVSEPLLPFVRRTRPNVARIVEHIWAESISITPALLWRTASALLAALEILFFISDVEIMVL